jgi:hypothetical protein
MFISETAKDEANNRLIDPPSHTIGLVSYFSFLIRRTSRSAIHKRSPKS